MSKCENVLNSIYCLSQEACSTIDYLKSVSRIANNIEICRLNVLLQMVHEDALEAYKEMSLNLSDKQGSRYITELLAIGQSIKNAYELFEISEELDPEHLAVDKLEHQIDVLSVMVYKLHKLIVQNNNRNVADYISE